MKQLKKKTKDEEENMKRLCKFVQTSTGHIIWKIRMLSSLSHNEVNMRSPINSSTEWRIEHENNCCISTYTMVVSEHLKALDCNFQINNLYQQTYNSIREGECLVLMPVKPSELYKYNPHQILLTQKPGDKEKLEKRIKNEKKNLQISCKLVVRNEEKKQLKKKQDKKKNAKK